MHGIDYRTAEKPKSDYYLELLSFVNSGTVELLDHPRLTTELMALERRTARSGKDSVDHPPGGHDDVINAVAGVLVTAAKRVALSVEAVGMMDEYRAAWRPFPSQSLVEITNPFRRGSTSAGRWTSWATLWPMGVRFGR